MVIKGFIWKSKLILSKIIRLKSNYGVDFRDFYVYTDKAALVVSLKYAVTSAVYSDRQDGSGVRS